MSFHWLDEGTLDKCHTDGFTTPVHSKVIEPTPGIPLKTDELSGSKSLILKAILSGGEGEHAWQHTQLFRTKMNNPQNDFQFKLLVKLRKIEI